MGISLRRPALMATAALALAVMQPVVRGGAPASVAVGTAFVSLDPDAQEWLIGNESIRVKFRLTPTKNLVLDQLSSPSTGRVLNTVIGPDSTVTVNGVSAPLGGAMSWTFDGASSSPFGTGVRLTFSFLSTRAPITAERIYVAYPDSPTIEMWSTFRATSSAPVTLTNVGVWDLTMRASAIHYLRGLNQDKAGAAVDDTFSLRSDALQTNAPLTLVAENRSTENYVPVVAVDAEPDEFYGGLMWSGAWGMTALRHGADVQLTAGLPLLTTAVDASHPLETPHGFVGFVRGNGSDVSEALRAFIIQGVRQGRPFDPLVTYNTWFAYGTEVDAATMMDEMVAAASLGVELFVIDAGWYLGAGTGMDFDSGLGVWEADRGRFPDGLAVLREQAHALGMQFGLWVEPERVDLSTVGKPGLAREIWLAKRNDNYGGTGTAQICFASPAARQWILERLFALLDEAHPDYLKWDNNFWVNCNRSGHGHGPGDGNFAHVTGLYDVLRQIRARYPTMQIENCSQGGNRLDFGMLRYTDAAWMDDRTGPAAHVRHNLEGLMTFLPPAYLLSFVVENENEPLIDSPDLPLTMRSRMPGILGLTYIASELAQTDRDAIASEVALYKSLRAITRDASGRLLTDQATEVGGPEWDGLQELSTARGDAVIFAFQNDSAVRRVTVRPERLDPDAVYEVRGAEGMPLGRASGAALMTDGIELDASPASAAHVLLIHRTSASVIAANKRRCRGCPLSQLSLFEKEQPRNFSSTTRREAH